MWPCTAASIIFLSSFLSNLRLCFFDPSHLQFRPQGGRTGRPVLLEPSRLLLGHGSLLARSVSACDAACFSSALALTDSPRSHRCLNCDSCRLSTRGPRVIVVDVVSVLYRLRELFATHVMVTFAHLLLVRTGVFGDFLPGLQLGVHILDALHALIMLDFSLVSLFFSLLWLKSTTRCS